MAEICATEGFTDAYVSQLLPLAFLAPEIVEGILSGRQPAGLTANRLIWGERLPVDWEELASLDSGAHWTVRSVGTRLAIGNAPWDGYEGARASIRQAAAALDVPLP